MKKIKYDYENYEEEDELIYVEKDGLCGLLSKDRKVICPCIYDNIKLPIGNYKEGYGVVVEKDRKKGLLSLDGKIILPCEYDWILEELNGNIEMKKNNNRGFVSINRGIVVPCNYTGYRYYSTYNNAELYAISDHKKIDGNLKWQEGIYYNNEEFLPCEYDKIKIKEIEEKVFIIAFKNEIIEIYPLDKTKLVLEETFESEKFDNIMVYSLENEYYVYVEKFGFGFDTIENMTEEIYSSTFMNCREEKYYLFEMMDKIKSKYITA